VPDDSERRRLEPALGALLGIDDVDWDAREQLYSAWRTFFERIADRGPSVLVFEDLQWADSGLFDFIDHLVKWTRDRPMLVIALARPEIRERRPTFGAGQSAFMAVHLEPLPDEAMSELLRGLVPQLPERDLQRIVSRAEGVPLYAVETVRSLADGGHLVRNGDVYELATELPELAVPPTLHALIASRLDGLEPPDRSLLQDASVIGLSFAVPPLAALTGRSPEEVEHSLRALAEKELVALNTDPRSPERGQYRFRQELVREVAYGTLARRDRRTRHLEAARFLESIGDEELAGVLANHYLEAYRAAPEGEEGAAVAAQARLALRAAAERASRLHSHEQALAYFEQAMAVTFDEAERTQLLIRAAASASPAGQVEKAEANLKAAIEWFEARADRVGAGRSAAELASVLLMASRIDEAIELLTRALANLPAEEVELAVALNGQLARAYLLDDKAEMALPAVMQALGAAEVQRLPALDLLITKSWALAATDRLIEGLALLRGVIQMADEQDEAVARMRARFNLASYLHPHDPHLALRTSLEGIAVAEHYGHSMIAANISGNAAGAAMVVGDLDRVLELESRVANVQTALATAVHGVAAGAVALRGDLWRGGPGGPAGLTRRLAPKANPWRSECYSAGERRAGRAP
jgi:predicted ATPase